MLTVEERFGNLIRYHLQQKNMTQEELGKYIGVTQRSVSSYINAKQQPSLSLVYNICKILDIDVREIFELEELSTGTLTHNESKIIEGYREIELDEEEKFQRFESIVKLINHM